MDEERRDFWHALEDVRDCQAVAAEWQAHMGSDYVGGKSYLRPTGGRASTHPCVVVGGCGCDHEVIVHGDEDIVAVCRCGCECDSFPLTRSDLAVLELDRAALDRAITQAFGFFEDCDHRTELPATTCMGVYSFSVRGRFPVYLTIRQEREELEFVANALIINAATPFVLAAPTRELCSARIEQRLIARKSAFFSLADNLALDEGGRFLPLRNVKIILDGFRAANQPTVSSSEQEALPGVAPAAVDLQQTPSEEWPDPELTCYAHYRLERNGTLIFRVQSEGGTEATAEFVMVNGQPTKQLQLMRILCEAWPSSAPLREAIEATYGAEMRAAARSGSAPPVEIVHCFRALVSAIREKLVKRHINPDILPAISPYKQPGADPGLKLASLNKWASDRAFDS